MVNNPAILSASESSRIRHHLSSLAQKIGHDDAELNHILEIIKIGQERGEAVGSSLFMLLPESLRKAAVL